MKKLLVASSLAGLLCSGAVLADDSLSRTTPTDHQMMKDCINKQKTADVSMSKSQMERICKDEIKRLKTPAAEPPASSDAPRSP